MLQLVANRQSIVRRHETFSTSSPHWMRQQPRAAWPALALHTSDRKGRVAHARSRRSIVFRGLSVVEPYDSGSMPRVIIRLFDTPSRLGFRPSAVKWSHPSGMLLNKESTIGKSPTPSCGNLLARLDQPRRFRFARTLRRGSCWHRFLLRRSGAHGGTQAALIAR